MDRLPFASFDDFSKVTDAACYSPVPDDWVIGLTDVVRSGNAVAAGRYKDVNTAGSAAISAVMNALGSRHFAFAFGGDGCLFAVPGSDAALVREALAATAAWVRDAVGLTLRAALVPVAELRENGVDVRIALFKPSPHVAYAMFDGGGVALAEAWMKAGQNAVTPAAVGVKPDLTGLSCRWQPLRSQHGAIVSIIARPGTGGDAAFRAAVQQLLTVLGEPAAFHPVPAQGAQLSLLSGLWLEARGRPGPRWRRVVAVLRSHLLGWTLFQTGLKVGRFDPSRYRMLTSANADTRKFGDGLLLTADLDAAGEAAIVAALDAAEANGSIRYGVHRQEAALMTCIVPSHQDDEHFHFVDGAGGGYATAAMQLKERERKAGELALV